MSVVSVHSLVKEFDTPSGTEVAVDGIDFDVAAGEFLSLVGPSGCGKTTTLRCLAGLERPTSGTIRFGDEDVVDTPANKRNVAMMFQDIALYPHMTVKDNISYPLKVRGVSKEDRYAQAREAAEIMQIADFLEKHPGDLSGGQRQRAALARTIVQDPVAFLMDEPLSDLDAKLKVEIRKEIQRVHKRLGKPTIYVTHDQEEAMTMSDRIIVMNEGHIEQIGTPREVYHVPANLFVAQFIGNPSMNTFEGTVDGVDDGVYTVSVSGQRFEIGAELDDGIAAGESVLVGIRPSGVAVGPEATRTDFECTLTLVELTGENTLTSLDGPQGEIRALVSGESTLSEDRVVPVSFAGGDVFLFDPDSGERLVKGSCR